MTKEELQEYYRQLEAHDWYFEQSDDIHVWRRGKAKRNELYIASTKSPEAGTLWKEWNVYMFSGKPWGTEKAPKPVFPE